LVAPGPEVAIQTPTPGRWPPRTPRRRVRRLLVPDQDVAEGTGSPTAGSYNGSSAPRESRRPHPHRRTPANEPGSPPRSWSGQGELPGACGCSGLGRGLTSRPLLVRGVVGHAGGGRIWVSVGHRQGEVVRGTKRPLVPSGHRGVRALGGSGYDRQPARRPSYYEGTQHALSIPRRHRHVKRVPGTPRARWTTQPGQRPGRRPAEGTGRRPAEGYGAATGGGDGRATGGGTGRRGCRGSDRSRCPPSPRPAAVAPGGRGRPGRRRYRETPRAEAIPGDAPGTVNRWARARSSSAPPRGPS
jgi:hypothetical protein